MYYFHDVFTTFLGLWSESCLSCQWRDKNLSAFISNIYNYIQKMNKRSKRGLEQHEGEHLMTELNFFNHPFKYAQYKQC